MPGELKGLLLAIIPIFVAMDAIGVLPIFISLTEGMTARRRRQVVRASIATALAVSLGFVAVGKIVFALIGVSISDFKVAGGVILLVLAIHDLLFPERRRGVADATVGVVPLGVPLIVGPAVLTTAIISVDAYGYLPTIFSLVINLIFAWGVFWHAGVIMRLLGSGGAKGVGKVISLLLAAIAVMMIRRGIVDMLAGR